MSLTRACIVVLLLGCGGSQARDPVLAWHESRGADAYTRGDYTASRMAYLAALRLAPEDGEVALAFYRAQAALTADIDLPISEEEARLTDHWIDLLLERFPEEKARWLTARGGLRAGFGDLVGSHAALTAAHEADPHYERAVLRLAAMLGATERGTEAEAVLEQARRDFPKSQQVRKQLADLMIARKGHADAIAVLQESLRIAPDASIYVQMAEAMVAAGDPVRADATYRDALKLTPDWPPAMRGLGYAKLAQGERDQARMVFERYLMIAPTRGVPAQKVEEIRQIVATLTPKDPSKDGFDAPGMRLIQKVPVDKP